MPSSPARVGEDASAREVGQSLGRNPFPIIVPCHRIVASSGELGGFSAPGGTATKRRLLTIEDARRDGVDDLFDQPSPPCSDAARRRRPRRSGGERRQHRRHAFLVGDADRGVGPLVGADQAAARQAVVADRLEHRLATRLAVELGPASSANTWKA